MPRNMSFALTTYQVRNKTKTVTRRFGWWFLKPGDVVNAVEKSMGLKPGEKIKRICQIRVISVRKEPLSAITEEDVVKEGFIGWTVRDFIDMLAGHNKCSDNEPVNRIEFEYL